MFELYYEGCSNCIILTPPSNLEFNLILLPPMQRSSQSEFNINTVKSLNQPDDFAREVYGVLGIPVDVTDMATVLRKIEAAGTNSAPFLISTANLNFLVSSQCDGKFRDSLLLSDLCTADGMPIVWIARLF